MTGMPSQFTDLLAECEARGIRLALAGDGRLTIDAPQDALIAGLLDQLKAHKTDLLAMLLPVPSVPASPKSNPQGSVQSPQKPRPLCRCGSTTKRDVVLRYAPHDGTTIRRDCAVCGRFLDFALWYGKDAGHIGQYPIH